MKKKRLPKTTVELLRKHYVHKNKKQRSKQELKKEFREIMREHGIRTNQ